MSTPIARQSFAAVTQQRVLNDQSPVTIVFRGGPPIVDKFDGMDIILPAEAKEARRSGTDPHWARRYYPPCVIENVPYAAAAHIRSRAIVPGTRDPHNGGRKASYQIAIQSTPTGTMQDRPEYCEPFTDEQLEFFKLPEGLNRQAFEDSRRDVKTLDTTASISHVGNIHEQLEAEPDAATLAPPADHEGLKEIHAGAAGYDGDDASRTRRGRPRFKDDK
jgi:hypothetical protein